MVSPVAGIKTKMGNHSFRGATRICRIRRIHDEAADAWWFLTRWAPRIPRLASARLASLIGASGVPTRMHRDREQPTTDKAAWCNRCNFTPCPPWLS
jgi:hypothetical protein